MGWMGANLFLRGVVFTINANCSALHVTSNMTTTTIGTYGMLYIPWYELVEDRLDEWCSYRSHTSNSHNQVRGHKTGSSHSGVEESPRDEYIMVLPEL